MKSIYTYIVAFLVIVVTCVSTGNSQTVVIAHKDVPQKKLSKTQLLEIYTLNQARWDDGTRVKVIDMKQNTTMKQTFYEHIDMEQNALRKIWLKKQFTGKALPPKLVDNEQDVLDRVENTQGAIGYVSLARAKRNKSVKILYRIR
jgi:ABC-type phosphate transport system substrate-binding protein